MEPFPQVEATSQANFARRAFDYIAESHAVRTFVATLAITGAAFGFSESSGATSVKPHSSVETCTTKNGVTSCEEIISDNLSREHTNQSETVTTTVSSGQTFLLDTHWTNAAEQKSAAVKGECEWISGANAWVGGWVNGETGKIGYRRDLSGSEVDVCLVPTSEVPGKWREIMKPAEQPDGKIYIKVGEKKGLDAKYGIKDTDCGNPVIVGETPPKAETHPGARVVGSAAAEDEYIATAYVDITAKVDATAKAIASTPDGSCYSEAELAETGTYTAVVHASAESTDKLIAKDDAKANVNKLVIGGQKYRRQRSYYKS